VFDTLDTLVTQIPEVAAMWEKILVRSHDTDYPYGYGKFKAFAAAVPNGETRCVTELWFNEHLMRTGRLADPDIGEEAGKSVAFPHAGRDTVSLPGFVAHEAGHAVQRWLEEQGYTDALDHALHDLLSDHTDTLRRFTAQAFDRYTEAQQPREVFADLYAARYVLAHRDTIPPDQVHPALHNPAVQAQIATFGTVVDNLINQARDSQKGDS
jgi:hypothetical protein